LKKQLEYEYILQSQLVTALCCLHNFIRIEGDSKDEFELDDSWQSAAREWQENRFQVPSFRKDVTEKEKREAKNFQDNIAKEMWTQYLKTVRDRE